MPRPTPVAGGTAAGRPTSSPRSDSLEVYVVRLGQPQRTGFLIDRLDTVRVNGETMLRRIQRTTDATLGSSVDTLVHALATLQPRSVRSHSDRGTERLDWQTSRVVGVVDEPDSPLRSVDSPLPRGWYSSASFDLILRASPLADGYGLAVPSFSGREGSRVLTAKVASSEEVEGQGDTWRIEADRQKIGHSRKAPTHHRGRLVRKQFSPMQARMELPASAAIRAGSAVIVKRRLLIQAFISE